MNREQFLDLVFNYAKTKSDLTFLRCNAGDEQDLVYLKQQEVKLWDEICSTSGTLFGIREQWLEKFQLPAKG